MLRAQRAVLASKKPGATGRRSVADIERELRQTAEAEGKVLGRLVDLAAKYELPDEAAKYEALLKRMDERRVQREPGEAH